MPCRIRYILPNYTYDDYVNWEGQWELIDGIPFSKWLELVPVHQFININAGTEFYFVLKAFKHCKAYPSIAYKVQEHTVFQPDMLVVCKSIQKKFLDFPPPLVVEVLSPSSVFIDRHTKFYAYHEQAIPYGLIITPETEETEIYVLEEGEHRLKEKAANFTYSFCFDDDCEATIDFSKILK